jgi:hypothetical protein
MTNNKKYHNNNGLNPNFLSGFVDGEGCFYIGVSQNNNYSIG